MSAGFSFGTGTPTSGSFGVPPNPNSTSTTTALFNLPSTNSAGSNVGNFSLASSSAPGPISNFNFGQATTPSTSAGFAFNLPPSNADTVSSFSFGKPPAPNNSSLNFANLPASGTPTTSGSFSLPSGGVSTSSGFSFGLSAMPTSTQTSSLSTLAPNPTIGNFPLGGASISAVPLATASPNIASSFNLSTGPPKLSNTTSGITTDQLTSTSNFMTSTSQPATSQGFGGFGTLGAKLSNSSVSPTTTSFSQAATNPLLSKSYPQTTAAYSLTAPISAPASTLSIPMTSTVEVTSSASLTSATTTSSTFGLSGQSSMPNMSVRQLEEKLNKWLVELKEQEERFIRQADHVNSWDQILQKGHEQVHSLKTTLHTVKSDQSRLEAELDFIKGQQHELERLLEPIESAVCSAPAGQLHQGDRQRDNMYHLAQTLDSKLRQMTDDLSKTIEQINSNCSASRPNDPVSQVAKILSVHMDTLKWLDQNANQLSRKIEDVSKITIETGKKT